MVSSENAMSRSIIPATNPTADPIMDAGTAILPRPADLELIPEDYFAPLDLGQVFPRPGPLEVDLGCGDGRFLVALAERFPERNFLGIEKLAGRVEAACRKGARRGLPNVRVLRIETSYAIQYLLPPASVEVVHLLFPDPWPKERHQRRRIVTAGISRPGAPSARRRRPLSHRDRSGGLISKRSAKLISLGRFVEENGGWTRFSSHDFREAFRGGGCADLSARAAESFVSRERPSLASDRERNPASPRRFRPGARV